MSKGLEALKEIVFNYVQVFKNNENGKQMFMEDVHIIEKELKALEIIRNKGLNTWWFKKFNSYEEYKNKGCEDLATELTQEEYDLLKEVRL